MNVSDFLQPAQVIADLRARDKAQLMAELSRRAAAILLIEPRSVGAALTTRERLGSTGLGRGFAFPHARLDGLDHFFGLFARLARPIDFDAIDERPVDLVFMLLIPENAGNEHVAALATISRRMRDQTLVQQLRTAVGAAEMYAVLTDATA